ncbi:MAG: hypothetical protein M3R68_03690 [Acidobacteriota bacterium]|nr:hypothetical protein [Acidobacteriota bacterium]
MLELYFLFYRVPKMMTRLARERNRSAVAWSLLGIGAWIGAELAVVLGGGLLYGIGMIVFGWSEEIPIGVRLFMYILALAAALCGVTIVQRILVSRSREKFEPLPPPPPKF